MLLEKLDRILIAYCFGVLNVFEFFADRLHPIATLLLGAGMIAGTHLFLPPWTKMFLALFIWAPGMTAIVMVLSAYWATRGDMEKQQ